MTYFYMLLLPVIYTDMSERAVKSTESELEILRTKIGQLEKKIGQLEKKIEQLETKIEQVEKQGLDHPDRLRLPIWEQQLAGLQQQLAGLQQNLAELRKEKNILLDAEKLQGRQQVGCGSALAAVMSPAISYLLVGQVSALLPV